MAKKNENANMQSIIKEIKSSPEIMVFFKRLWKNNNFQRFFFAQKPQIFPVIDDDFIGRDLPFLFWSNLPQKVKKENIAVFITTSELEQEKVENLTTVMNERYEEVARELKDFAAYYLIKFIRSNKEIKQLIEDENFSYNLMKSTLKDYSKINTVGFDDFKEIDTLMTGKTDLDRETIQTIKNLVDAFEKTKREIELKWFDLFNAIDFSGMKGKYYMWGYGNLLRLLKTQGIKKDDYEDILSELYKLKLIKNMSTAFWCEHCIDEPFISHSQSNIAPTQFVMKCPKCGKGMAFSTAYDLHLLLKRMIYYPDGLLSCAFGWVLNHHDVEYINSSYSKEYEHDFIITPQGKRFLVECKMHNTSKDKQTIENHLINDLIQLVKHMKALEKENTKVDGGYVLTNHLLGNSQDTVRKAYTHSKIKGYRKKHNIEVIDYTQIGALLKKFGVKLE